MAKPSELGIPLRTRLHNWWYLFTWIWKADTWSGRWWFFRRSFQELG